jgi:hypothetical protein
VRSTRHLKNHSMGRNERVTYSRPSRTRARPLLAPVVRSCPRGAPTRPLLVPARFSYSSATPTRPLLVPGGCSLPLRGEVRARPLPLRGEVRAPPGHGHYPGCEHPRARALPGVRTRATRVLLVHLPVHVLVPVTALTSTRTTPPTARQQCAARAARRLGSSTRRGGEARRPAPRLGGAARLRAVTGTSTWTGRWTSNTRVARVRTPGSARARGCSHPG